MSIEREVLEAIAQDLNSNAGLAGHGTILGRRPRKILPTDCPLLVVALDGKTPAPVTTEEFDAILRVAVTWHEEAVEEARTLMQDNALTWSLVDAITKIEGRIRHLSRTNGLNVDGAWELAPADTTYVGPVPNQGLTEGYALLVEVAVTE